MSLFLANVVLLVLNLPLVGLWVQVLRIPYIALFPIILLFCVIGAYSVNNSMADVYLMLCFGVLGYLMNKGGFPVHPLVLAMIMEPILETSFRQALSISGGDYRIFFSSMISVGLLAIVAIVIIASTFRPIRRMLDAALVRNN